MILAARSGSDSESRLMCYNCSLTRHMRKVPRPEQSRESGQDEDTLLSQTSDASDGGSVRVFVYITLSSQSDQITVVGVSEDYQDYPTIQVFQMIKTYQKHKESNLSKCSVR